MNTLVKLDTSKPALVSDIEADKLLSGEPSTSLWNVFSDPSEQFNAGIWQSEACKLSVEYTEHELCVILEGEVSITSADGVNNSYKAGDSFVIPAGFTGTWESLNPVKKIYASYEDNSGE